MALYGEVADEAVDAALRGVEHLARLAVAHFPGHLPRGTCTPSSL